MFLLEIVCFFRISINKCLKYKKFNFSSVIQSNLERMQVFETLYIIICFAISKGVIVVIGSLMHVAVSDDKNASILWVIFNKSVFKTFTIVLKIPFVKTNKNLENKKISSERLILCPK